jgi:ankyrin repeat protein
MSNQNKVTYKWTLHMIQMIFVSLFALQVPFNAYGADLDANIINAVLNGDTVTMKSLLAQGADVTTKDRIYGRTLLHLAVEKGHADMVELLLDNGADVNAKDEVNGWAPLHQAAQRDNKNMVILLIAKGANVNIKDDVNNRTPLFFAVLWGNNDMVEVLLNNGAEVNAKDAIGETPLTCAARCGHVEIAQLLKKAGAKE